MKARHEYLEFTPKGFIRHTRRWLWYWKHELVEWKAVKSIRAVMWDCVSCHAFGFRLILSDTNSVSITDIDDQWDDFRAQLYKVFPDIDQTQVKEVEGFFPGEGELTCWETKQAQQVAAPDGE